LTIPAVIALVAVADPVGARIGALIFGVSLAALYGSSAAYHRLAWTERSRRIMRRLDHSMIFVLIAGTYTPVCLLALPSSWAIPMLLVVWGFALIGVITKVIGTDRIMRISNSLYIVIGWVGVIALPVLLRTVSLAALTLLMLGGVLYTVGAVFFFLKRPDPNPAVFGYHEVWHSFTVLAGVSHFGMVALLLR
jgi:hemolysin III